MRSVSVSVGRPSLSRQRHSRQVRLPRLVLGRRVEYRVDGHRLLVGDGAHREPHLGQVLAALEVGILRALGPLHLIDDPAVHAADQRVVALERRSPLVAVDHPTGAAKKVAFGITQLASGTRADAATPMELPSGDWRFGWPSLGEEALQTDGAGTTQFVQIDGFPSAKLAMSTDVALPVPTRMAVLESNDVGINRLGPALCLLRRASHRLPGWRCVSATAVAAARCESACRERVVAAGPRSHAPDRLRPVFYPFRTTSDQTPSSPSPCSPRSQHDPVCRTSEWRLPRSRRIVRLTPSRSAAEHFAPA